MAGNLKYPLCVEWTTEIPPADESRRSPDFSFQNSAWFLELTLWGSLLARGYFNIYLYNKEKSAFKVFQVKVYVKDCLSSEEPKLSQYYTFENSPKHRIWQNSTKDISAHCPRIFSDYKLTVFCLFFSEEAVKTQVLKLNSSGTPSGTTVSDDLQSLSRDFTTFLEDETFSDVKLKCGDRTFSAHTSVLAARSEVFAAMFRNKMAERDTGMVVVQDVDSEVFELLLQYVYSGKRPDLSEDTVRHLYEAADKYAVHALKKTCSEWMVEELTIENGLDVLVLADKYSDENFKEGVAHFVAENLHIHNSVSWSAFKEAHPQLAVKVYDKRLADALSHQAACA